MRGVAYLLLLLMLVGCAANPPTLEQPPGSHQGAPAQERPGGDSPSQALPVTHPPAKEPVREVIPGGFRIGPFDGGGDLFWLNPEQVWIYASAGGVIHRGLISLSGGGVHLDPPDPTEYLNWERWHYLRSPDGRRAVAYHGKLGTRRFVDREAGTAADPGLPRFYGSNVFDAWSPDSRHFLVQSVRTDSVPGFYFLDHDGKLAASFDEPGYYSHRGVWSPDGRRVAFLSVPIDLIYPRSPEEWEEMPFGERVGVLNLETGEATYFALEGRSFFGFPIWATDGSSLAIGCGALEIVKNVHPFEEYDTTHLRNPRPCLLDLATGVATPVGEGIGGLGRLEVLGVGARAALVFHYGAGASGYGWMPLDGGPMVALPDSRPSLVAGGLAAMVITSEGSLDRLVLLNEQGREVRTLAEGVALDRFVASPDGEHVAFYQGDYLTVLQIRER